MMKLSQELVKPSQGNEPGHPAGDGANKKGDGWFQMSIHFVDFRCPSISWVWGISHTVCYTSPGVKFDALTITSPLDSRSHPLPGPHVVRWAGNSPSDRNEAPALAGTEWLARSAWQIQRTRRELGGDPSVIQHGNGEILYKWSLWSFNPIDPIATVSQEWITSLGSPFSLPFLGFHVHGGYPLPSLGPLGPFLHLRRLGRCGPSNGRRFTSCGNWGSKRSHSSPDVGPGGEPFNNGGVPPNQMVTRLPSGNLT